MQAGELLNAIRNILITTKFPLEDEKALQVEMQKVFTFHKLHYVREYFLSEGNEVDFMMDEGIVIEVKIKGSRRAIYEQCLRYSMHDEVKQVILFTSKSLNNPPLYNGKPFHVINISKAWL